MKYQFKTALLFLLLLTVAACKREVFIPDQPENGKTFQERVGLELVERLEFAIDSVFNVDNLSALGTFQEDQQQYVYFLTNERVYIYALEDQLLVRVVPLAHEGPNAVGPFSTFDGLVMKSLDTIYFVNHSTGKLYRLNDQGEVMDQVNVNNAQPTGAYYSYGLNDLQMIGDRLLLPAYVQKGIMDFPTYFSGLVYDWSTQSGTGVFHYPDIYSQVYWGYHTFLRWSSATFSPNKRRYFVSFAIDPRVYVYDEQFNLIGEEYLGSTEFTAIPPQSDDAGRWLLKEGRNVPGNDAYFERTPFFFGSMFHRETGTYIRMVRHGIDKDAGREQVRLSLIFADEDLNKTGEYFIPGIYFSTNIFPMPKGLAFLNVDQYDREEKKLRFDVLRFKELSGE